jgi:hypothetical protein
MTNHPSLSRARAGRVLIVLGALVLASASRESRADSFYLTLSNDLPPNNNYAQVVLTQQGSGSGTVQFQITAILCAPPYTSSSTPVIVGFAFNTSLTISMSNITFIPASSGVGWKLTSKQTCDGFGQFSYLLSGPKSSNPIVFNISSANAKTSSFEGGSTLKYEFAANIAGFTTSSTPPVTSQWASNKYSSSQSLIEDLNSLLTIGALVAGLVGVFIVWLFFIRKTPTDHGTAGGTVIPAGPPLDASE